DADVRIVVERQVDVRLRDEVHGQPLAGWAADGDADGSVARSEQRERGGKDRPRPLLGVAEEAPGPLPRADPRRREIAELVGDHLDPRGHQVDEYAGVEAERRPVELLVADETVMVVPGGAGEAP